MKGFYRVLGPRPPPPDILQYPKCQFICLLYTLLLQCFPFCYSPERMARRGSLCSIHVDVGRPRLRRRFGALSSNTEYSIFYIFLYSIETVKWTYTETRNKSRVVFETRAAILRRRSCSASVKAQTLNDVDARQHIHVAVIINCNCQRYTDGCG